MCYCITVLKNMDKFKQKEEQESRIQLAIQAITEKKSHMHKLLSVIMWQNLQFFTKQKDHLIIEERQER